MRSPTLVVALDTPEYDRADTLVSALAPLGVMFKVGLEALYGYGDRVRHRLEGAPGGYFVDAKLHDIPRTVGAAVRALVGTGVRIINVHALGGNAMMEAAVESAAERAGELGIDAPAIFAVTILTSIGPEDLRELGLSGGPGENAIRLAALARDARCDGVVCSAHEVADLKQFFGGEFEALVPGIRPAGAAHDDQKRAATPAEAVRSGADYLVVGRAITGATDPLEAARRILEDMQAA